MMRSNVTVKITISDTSKFKLAGTEKEEEKEEGKSGEKKTKEELEEERKKKLEEEERKFNINGNIKEAKRFRKITINRDEKQRTKLRENYPPRCIADEKKEQKEKRDKKFVQTKSPTSADADSRSLKKKNSTGNNNKDDASSKIVGQIHTFTITNNFPDVLKRACAENSFDEDNDSSGLDATSGDGNEITDAALLEMLVDVAAVSWMFFFFFFFFFFFWLTLVSKTFF